MDEKKEAQEIQEQAEREAKEKAAKEKAALDAGSTPTPSGEEGKEPDTKSPLEEARALDKSIKEGTARMQKLLEKNEKIFADAALAGKGFAGQAPPPPKTEDEKWAEDAKIRYAGTGMDPTPDEDSGPTKFS